MKQSEIRRIEYCNRCGREITSFLLAIYDLYPDSPMYGLCDWCRDKYIEAKYPDEPTPKDK